MEIFSQSWNKLIGKKFEETFVALPTMGIILIGITFLKKYSVNLILVNISYTSRNRHCNWNTQIKTQMQLVWIQSRSETRSTTVPRNDCSDVHERRHKHVTGCSWSHLISEPENSPACNTCDSEVGKQHDTHSNQQPKWPYLRNQPRCKAGKLYKLDAEPSYKRETHITGTTQSNQSNPGRSTASNRPTFPRAHLQWRQKMVPNNRHVHWFWHPQSTWRTNLRWVSQAQGTREAQSNGIRRATTDVPLPFHLEQLTAQPQRETTDRTVFG